MAYFKFTKAILAQEPIELFNFGDCWRDFTFIDDLVHSIRKLAAIPPSLPGDGRPPGPDPA